ncbi:MAG: hypothetical protein AAF846_28180 [Chloroflexota bacterium]
MKVRLLLILIGLLMLALPSQAQDVEIDSIVFARDVTYGDVTPIQPAEIFPESITAVYAVIEGEGLEEGEEIDIIWYLDGEVMDELFYENDTEDDEFVVWTNWSDPNGMEEGDWSIEVLYDGDTIGEAEVEITDDEYIYPIRFGEDCGRGTGVMVGEADEFDDLDFIYVYIEWANFNDEESIELLWEINGDVFDLDIVIEVEDEGWECAFLTNGGDPLPSGDYRLSVVRESDGDEYITSEEISVND